MKRHSMIPLLNELLLSVVLKSNTQILAKAKNSDLPIPNELVAKVEGRIPLHDLQLYSILAQQGLFSLNEETIDSLDLESLMGTVSKRQTSSSKQPNPVPHLGSATPVPLDSVPVEGKEDAEDSAIHSLPQAQDSNNILNPPRLKSESIEESKQRTTVTTGRFPDEL